MSGHSKWATIKRKKAVTDAARARIFSKYIKEITIAARVGGGDPDANARLRTAMATARSVNMPAHNIERAVERGVGGGEGTNYEEAHYEGYGPRGVAILIEVATDNRNRTGGDVRSVLTKFGGSMAAAGAVAYLFKPRGLIEVPASAIGEDELMEIVLEAGADDVSSEGESRQVLTPVAAFESVKKALADAQIPLTTAEVTKIASVEVPLTEKEAAAALRLVDALEDNEDVQKVYANFSIADDVLARLSL
ncbi:MAG: YebC/PmpR family DNA-binding transcriptional regulator [Candidatus Eisenbacteria bacterium]